MIERISILRTKINWPAAIKKVEDVQIELNSDETKEGVDRKQKEFVPGDKIEYLTEKWQAGLRAVSLTTT